MCAPFQFIKLTSGIVSGSFPIAVRPQLPVPGVDLILGSDLAGGKIFPSVTNPIVENAVKPFALFVPHVRRDSCSGTKS